MPTQSAKGGPEVDKTTTASIVIVVVAYDRTVALQRLLASLSKVILPPRAQIDTVISIDYSPKQQEVLRSAQAFLPQLQNAMVIAHPINLGLKQHVLKCGDLVENYDYVLMLEDDLCVSPFILVWLELVSAGLKSCKSSKNVAQISTYSPRLNETSKQPFFPMSVGSTFYAQLPSSWGQAWDRKNWFKFRRWLEAPTNRKPLPTNVARWSTQSWKKLFTQYLVDSNLFVIYPVTALSTNFGDPGQHQIGSSQYQSPLELQYPHVGVQEICEAMTYDAWLDPYPESLALLSDDLKGYNFVCNFTLDKYTPPGTWELSPIKRSEVRASWAGGMQPTFVSAILGVSGKEIFLSRGRPGKNIAPWLRVHSKSSLLKMLISLPMFRRFIRFMKVSFW